mmetsp:Transcript_25567/g.81061  ORF Transcript_25567/g.81061 Transcript_25567/m.81061 type:complete len:270 (-) Transcript_25567:571-1380(-)
MVHPFPSSSCCIGPWSTATRTSSGRRQRPSAGAAVTAQTKTCGPGSPPAHPLAAGWVALTILLVWAAAASGGHARKDQRYAVPHRAPQGDPGGARQPRKDAHGGRHNQELRGGDCRRRGERDLQGICPQFAPGPRGAGGQCQRLPHPRGAPANGRPPAPRKPESSRGGSRSPRPVRVQQPQILPDPAGARAHRPRSDPHATCGGRGRRRSGARRLRRWIHFAHLPRVATEAIRREGHPGAAPGAGVGSHAPPAAARDGAPHRPGHARRG